jgi:hypothetical protein
MPKQRYGNASLITAVKGAPDRLAAMNAAVAKGGVRFPYTGVTIRIAPK